MEISKRSDTLIKFLSPKFRPNTGCLDLPQNDNQHELSSTTDHGMVLGVLIFARTDACDAPIHVFVNICCGSHGALDPCGLLYLSYFNFS